MVNSGKELKNDVHKELVELCKDAPFDVGYDNIFSNLNGDAIIIDTEDKGEDSTNCIQKLSRYFKN